MFILATGSPLVATQTLLALVDVRLLRSRFLANSGVAGGALFADVTVTVAGCK